MVTILFILLFVFVVLPLLFYSAFKGVLIEDPTNIAMIEVILESHIEDKEVEAIKALRRVTGLGLEESKLTIDNHLPYSLYFETEDNVDSIVEELKPFFKLEVITY